MVGGHTLAARTQTRAATAAVRVRGLRLLDRHHNHARPGLAWASSGGQLHSNGSPRGAGAA